jgi:hypothetical protein
MQIANISLFLFAAMGTVASPIDAESDDLSARAVNAADIQYTGVRLIQYMQTWKRS